MIDLNHPDIRGLELVEQIRLNSIFTDIPVVIYTSIYSRHEARACEELNISLLKKPDTLEEWDKIASIMLQFCKTVSKILDDYHCFSHQPKKKFLVFFKDLPECGLCIL